RTRQDENYTLRAALEREARWLADFYLGVAAARAAGNRMQQLFLTRIGRRADAIEAGRRRWLAKRALRPGLIVMPRPPSPRVVVRLHYGRVQTRAQNPATARHTSAGDGAGPSPQSAYARAVTESGAEVAS